MAFLFGAIASTYFIGRTILYATILVSLLLGVAYTNFTIGLNALLYRCLASGKHGSTLGVYSSLNSIAMLLGSMLSGGTSFYFSYSLTFLFHPSFSLLPPASSNGTLNREDTRRRSHYDSGLKSNPSHGFFENTLSSMKGIPKS